MLHYGRNTLSSILLSTSKTRLDLAVWRSLIQCGISRIKPTRRGCRGGRTKERVILTVITNCSDVKFAHLAACNGYFDDGTANLHLSSGNSLNIHLDTTGSSKDIRTAVKQAPLVPTQKHSSLTTSLKRSVNTSNLINIPLTPRATHIPNQSMLASFCLLNARSINN